VVEQPIQRPEISPAGVSGKTGAREAPLVVHIIYRLAVGGLENSLVNLINLMPAERYRHAVVCLSDCTEYRDRIRRPDVPAIAIHKRDGQDPGAYWRLWKVLRRLRPAIVHTRTLGTLEGNLYAALARVPGRVHGEHSQSTYTSGLHQFRHTVLRKTIHPLVHHYTTVNNDLADWLVETAGVPRPRITRIYNGVDTKKFHPNGGSRVPLGPPGFAREDSMVIGTVGRMQPVKDQLMLVRAFLHALESVPEGRKMLRLVLVGDGPLREPALGLLGAANALDLAWLPGERADIAEIMRGLDVFVLPSRNEGTSNTILEAMASGLPVIATRVGGNPELVEEGVSGWLTSPEDPPALSTALRRYMENSELRRLHGQTARSMAQSNFSMEAMINGYLTVYDTVLHRNEKGEDEKQFSRTKTI
jgi:sugar transferase (PEP-CTERM/EpsH1 system associated)